MKMIPSIISTGLIVTAVFSAVWAQQLIPTNDTKHTTDASAIVENKAIAKSAKPNKATLPLSLVGISSLSRYENAEQQAQALFADFTENPKLISQLQNVKQLKIYLVYQDNREGQLKISAAIESKNLKHSEFSAIKLGAGRYQLLAPKGSDIKQLAAAWSKLDKQKMFNTVLETYRLDNRGNFIDGHSSVNYQ